MHMWQAVVLGVVEGITEYLPISSTGHLLVARELMHLDAQAQQTFGDAKRAKAALDAFMIVIQGGAILAVLGLYWPRFVQMLRGLLGKDNAGFMLLVNIGIAFVPSAVLGVILKPTIEEYLFNAPAVVVALVIGGVFMIIVDWKYVVPSRFAGTGASSGAGMEVTELTPGGALKIGLLQCVSLWPGTSRSMMTITGGVLSGLKPAAAAEFSFLLGMPTLLAASAYSLYKNLKEAKAAAAAGGTGHNMFQELGYGPVIVGMLVAAVCAAVAVKWLVGFLNRSGLTPFGIYRIAAGVVIFGLVVGGVMQIVN
jgi:undecaprenyl-diphosphatase